MEKIKWFFRKLLKAVVWFFLIAFASCIGVASGIATYQKMLQDGEFDGLLTASERKAAYNPVTGETEAVLPILTSAVFWSDGAPALHVGTFSIRAVGRSRYFVYNDTAYDLSQAVDRSISLQVGVRSTDYYVFMGNAMLVNTEMGAGFPSANSFTMDSYSIRYVFPTLLSGLMFEIKINEVGVAGNTGDTYSYTFTFATDYIADEYFYSAYYGDFDTTFIPNQKLYTATGEVVANAENGSYKDGYSVGYRDGLDIGYEDGEQAGYDTGYEDGEQAGYDTGYDDGYYAGQDVAYDQGYDQGYDVGFSNGSSQVEPGELNGSIKSFVFTLFDAPVSTFLNVFDFQFEGFDFLGVVRLILSLAVIFGIVKLVV